MSDADQALWEENQRLQQDIAALRKINHVLMKRVEASIDNSGSAYSIFEQNILLQKQIAARTSELNTSQQRLQTLFTQSLSGFFFMMLDSPIEWTAETDKEQTLDYAFNHQRMIQANQAMLDLYGAHESELIGLTPMQLFRHHLNEGRQLLRGLFDRGRWHTEIQTQRMDNDQPIIIDGDYICLYDTEGRITGCFGVQSDITERKQAQHQLQQLNTQLEHALQHAEQANLAKSEFLANMSHEIRTPMNAIIGMLYLALHTELTPKQRDYLSKIDGAAKSLLSIINDILDFSKIEAGKLELDSSVFNLDKVFSTLASIVGFKAEGQGLELIFDIAPEVPRWLQGDALRLNQILINLTDNAVKFTTHGKIIVKADLAPPDMTHHSPPPPADKIGLLFTIQDTGIGMNEQQLAGLFHAFCQGDASITRKHGGTGLGLAISKQLVELMGGQIWVDSTPGTGSTFQFIIYLATASAQSSDETISVRSTPSLAHLRGRRILVVEDNALNRDLITELLADLKLYTEVATNGIEGVEYATQKTFDLILMDIQMPEMDGLEATRRIRAHESGHNIPIIAMTAHAMSGDREKSLKVGMNEHLTKPVDPQNLVDILVRWLPQQAPTTHQQPPLSPPHRRQLHSITAAHASVELPEQLPGFDLKLALARCNGKKSLLHRLLLGFTKDYGQTMPRLREQLNTGDQETAQRMAHSLKGVAANLGATGIADAAGALELALAATYKQPLDMYLHALEQQLIPALAALESLADIANTANTVSVQSTSDPSVDQSIANLLLSLETQLHAHSLNARITFRHVYTRLQGQGFDTELQQLAGYMDTLNFTAALDCVEHITKTLLHTQ